MIRLIWCVVISCVVPFLFWIGTQDIFSRSPETALVYAFQIIAFGFAMGWPDKYPWEK